MSKNIQILLNSIIIFLIIIVFSAAIYTLFESYFSIKNAETRTTLYNLVCDEKIILSNVELLSPNPISDTWIYHKDKNKGSYRPKEDTICYAEKLLIKSHNGSNEMINNISFDDNKR